jgi:hypothetical protein
MKRLLFTSALLLTFSLACERLKTSMNNTPKNTYEGSVSISNN